MNPYLAAAAALVVVVGLAHSILGEVLIFSRLREGTLVPTNGGALLRERHVRILWATWHLVTVLGVAVAAMLLRLASEPAGGALRATVIQATAIGMFASGALVLGATRGRHPGWVGLFGVATLAWMGGAR